MNLVQVGERQAQELLFVTPFRLTCCELANLGLRRRRVGHLGDEIRCALRFVSIALPTTVYIMTYRLSNPVDQNPQQGHLQ